MIYLKNITNIEQAKLRYRKLAKQLHPDIGGNETDFKNMQNEYKQLLINLKRQNSSQNKVVSPSIEKELLDELGMLAKVLIKRQVPQNYLSKKIKTTESVATRDLLSGVVDFLNTYLK